MSQKALDVFFRHKFLITLPLVILVLVGLAASWSRQSTVYSANANVWTQRTPLLSSSLGGQGSFFTSPAGHQARVINDLLMLSSFRLSVAAKVDGLAGLDPVSQVRAVREDTAVYAAGVNVLRIRHSDEDPVLAPAIVQAIVDTYSETFESGVVTEAAAAEAFYEERLQQAGETLDERKAALASYQETLALQTLADATASDPQSEALLADVRQAEGDYTVLLDRLEAIHLQRDAALSGRDLSFQVMDPPTLPTSPLPTPKKDLLMFPALGLLLGLSASAGLLFAMIRLDSSIRLPVEARRIGVPILTVIPELGRRRRSWPQHCVRLVVAASRGLVGNLS